MKGLRLFNKTRAFTGGRDFADHHNIEDRMPKFKVEITETRTFDVPVEAQDEPNALALAYKIFCEASLGMQAMWERPGVMRETTDVTSIEAP